MENNYSLQKYVLIVAGVIAAGVVGYIAYMSYFSANASIGTGVDGINSENQDQPLVMPTTEEQKIDALDTLASPGNAPVSPVSASAKEEILNSSAKPSGDSTIPAGDAEKIKLLESLKK